MDVKELRAEVEVKMGVKSYRSDEGGLAWATLRAAKRVTVVHNHQSFASRGGRNGMDTSGAWSRPASKLKDATPALHVKPTKKHQHAANGPVFWQSDWPVGCAPLLALANTSMQAAGLLERV